MLQMFVNREMWKKLDANKLKHSFPNAYDIPIMLGQFIPYSLMLSFDLVFNRVSAQSNAAGVWAIGEQLRIHINRFNAYYDGMRG